MAAFGLTVKEGDTSPWIEAGKVFGSAFAEGFKAAFDLRRILSTTPGQILSIIAGYKLGGPAGGALASAISAKESPGVGIPDVAMLAMLALMLKGKIPGGLRNIPSLIRGVRGVGTATGTVGAAGEAGNIITGATQGARTVTQAAATVTEGAEFVSRNGIILPRAVTVAQDALQGVEQAGRTIGPAIQGASRFSGVLKVLGRVGAPLAVLSTAADVALAPKGEKGWALAEGIGNLGGGWAGAAAGGTIGTAIFPGVGTIIGGIIGGVVGAFAGGGAVNAFHGAISNASGQMGNAATQALDASRSLNSLQASADAASSHLNNLNPKININMIASHTVGEGITYAIPSHSTTPAPKIQTISSHIIGGHVPQFHGGGDVDQEGFAILKRKEMVLDEDLAQTVRNLANISIGRNPSSKSSKIIKVRIDSIIKSAQIKENVDVDKLLTQIAAGLNRVFENMGEEVVVG